MTPEQRKTMRMALEALERSVATCFDQYAHEQVMSRPEHFVNQAITALRQALDQQEFDRVHEALEKEAGIHVSQQPADELLRLRDLLGKANALARIRANEIESLKAKLKEKNT